MRPLSSFFVCQYKTEQEKNGFKLKQSGIWKGFRPDIDLRIFSMNIKGL